MGLALLAAVTAAAIVARAAAPAASTVGVREFKGKIALPGPGLATVKHFSVKATDWHKFKIKTNEAHLPAGIRAVAVIASKPKSRLEITIAINNLSTAAAERSSKTTTPHENLTFSIFRSGPGSATGYVAEIGKPSEEDCAGLISLGNLFDSGHEHIEAEDYSYDETVTVNPDPEELEAVALVSGEVQPSSNEEVWDYSAYNAAIHRTPECATGAPTGVELPDSGNS